MIWYNVFDDENKKMFMNNTTYTTAITHLQLDKEESMDEKKYKKLGLRRKYRIIRQNAEIFLKWIHIHDQERKSGSDSACINVIRNVYNKKDNENNEAKHGDWRSKLASRYFWGAEVRTLL